MRKKLSILGIFSFLLFLIFPERALAVPAPDSNFTGWKRCESPGILYYLIKFLNQISSFLGISVLVIGVLIIIIFISFLFKKNDRKRLLKWLFRYLFIFLILTLLFISSIILGVDELYCIR